MMAGPGVPLNPLSNLRRLPSYCPHALVFQGDGKSKRHDRRPRRAWPLPVAALRVRGREGRRRRVGKADRSEAEPAKHPAPKGRRPHQSENPRRLERDLNIPENPARKSRDMVWKWAENASKTPVLSVKMPRKA